MIIVVTGTPGSGKTYFSNLLGKRLKIEVLHVTDYVKKYALYDRIEDNEYIVRPMKLKKRLEKEISRKKDLIIEGHILSEFRLDNARVLVKREHLNKIRSRLEKRGYSKEKITNNLIDEAIDYCGLNAFMHYKNVYEFIRPNYNEIIEFLKGKRKNRFIELSDELIKEKII